MMDTTALYTQRLAPMSVSAVKSSFYLRRTESDLDLTARSDVPAGIDRALQCSRGRRSPTTQIADTFEARKPAATEDLY